MKTIDYPSFNETLHTFYIQDRLKVILIEKPYFHKTYVSLSTPLGALNTGYLDSEGKPQTVPKGIAHFLEHKIFEQDGQDISRQFALQEANINAYTEYTRTTYLFHSTNHLYDNIERLITMFFHPKFSEEGVEKEKNIILEELNMHLDDPYYRQYHTLLNGLYHHHPIKYDILGTKESIKAIDKSALNAMHEAYYRPEDSVLVVIGDFDVEALYQQLQLISLPKPTLMQPWQAAINEPIESVISAKTLKEAVLLPSLLIGIKLNTEQPLSPYQRIKFHLSFSIYMDLRFGKSSDFYEWLLDEKLINDAYGLDISLEKEYGYVLIGSETPNPEALYEALVEHLLNPTIKRSHIDDFNRVKKHLLGSFVMSLDSLEFVAHETSRLALDNLYIYDVIDIAQSITFEDVIAQEKHFVKAALSSVITEPKNDAQ